MLLYKSINVGVLGHGITAFLLNETCFNIAKQKRRKKCRRTMRSQGTIMESLIKDSSPLCPPWAVIVIQIVKKLLYPSFFGQTLEVVMMYTEFFFCY